MAIPFTLSCSNVPRNRQNYRQKQPAYSLTRMYIVYVHVSILHKICHPTWQCNDLFKPHDQCGTKLFFIAFLSKLNKHWKKCRDFFFQIASHKKGYEWFAYLFSALCKQALFQGVFTCSILASIVTILVSIVVILTSIEPIL